MQTLETPRKSSKDIPYESLQLIVDHLSIGKLVSTDTSPFWYKREGEDKFASRYKHETGKKGDIFYDGNNGDRWKVLAINTTYNRIIVENLTQHGRKLAYWE